MKCVYCKLEAKTEKEHRPGCPETFTADKIGWAILKFKAGQAAGKSTGLKDTSDSASFEGSSFGLGFQIASEEIYGSPQVVAA